VVPKWGFVYPDTEVVKFGVIQHIYGTRFTLGEPSGEKTERVTAMIAAGFRYPVRRIRDELWVKLWGNLSFNPISALTLQTLGVVATAVGTRAVPKAMMREAQEIGTKLGVRFPPRRRKRIDGAAAQSARTAPRCSRTSNGASMEIDALVTAVRPRDGMPRRRSHTVHRRRAGAD
jgi:2-dehydropantoate 2-reductase